MPRVVVSVACLNSYNVGSFGRHAQIAYLSDSLRNSRSILHQATRITELSKVDDQLQELLSTVMEQGNNVSWAHYCGAISTSIRYAANVSLFPQPSSPLHIKIPPYLPHLLRNIYFNQEQACKQHELTWLGLYSHYISTLQIKLTPYKVAKTHRQPSTH